MIKRLSMRTVAIGAAMVFAGFLPVPASAQRANDWDWDGNYQRLARIGAGKERKIQQRKQKQAHNDDAGQPEQDRDRLF